MPAYVTVGGAAAAAFSHPFSVQSMVRWGFSSRPTMKTTRGVSAARWHSSSSAPTT